MAIPLKWYWMPGPWPSKEVETFLRLFDHTQVILLDGTNGKLDGGGQCRQGKQWQATHNFRGIHSSSHNLQPDFCVLLDDLGIFV